MLKRPVTLLVIASFAAACGHHVGPQTQRAPAPLIRGIDLTKERVPAAWSYSLGVPVAEAEHGMVASNSQYASHVGSEILRAGGNAVDAAVATAFALAVTYPRAGNLGGGGFIVLHTSDGRDAALDFRETAPAAATENMYVDANGSVTENSLVGHLSAGVPGAVAGLWEVHQKYGKKPWRELVQPAIDLAENGFIVDVNFADAIRAEQQTLARFPTTAALVLPNGAPPVVGTTWRNPDLANVLRRIAERGAAGFYEGETADLIVAEMKRGNGLITHDDLRSYKPQWRDPVKVTYRGHTVISMPPASSGGLTMGLALNILQGYDLKSLGWHSTKALHLIAEAERRAFADRNTYLGDPDFVKVPRDIMLSTDYAAKQRATIDESHATPSSQIRPGLGTIAEATHTTHFSVVDENGGAVAMTTTLNDNFGSHVVVGGAGFFLNDEMDDFTSKVGAPNMYGLIQGKANAIAPNKRMLSAMTPTIVLDTAKAPLLVTGAAGGPRIISGTMQIVINVLDYGMDLGVAMSAPRIHHQHLPDTLYYEEKGLPQAVIDSLTAMGHAVGPRGTVGNVSSILRKGKVWTGMADPRLGGSAEGY